MTQTETVMIVHSFCSQYTIFFCEMTLEIEKLLDETRWHLLRELQQHARLS